MERWRMGDPAKVYERIEAMERRQLERSKPHREEVARKKLKALFESKEPDEAEHRNLAQ